MDLTFEQRQKILEVLTRPGSNTLDILSLVCPGQVINCMNCTVDNLVAFNESTGLMYSQMKEESAQALALAGIFRQLAEHLEKYVHRADEHFDCVMEKAD